MIKNKTLKIATALGLFAGGFIHSDALAQSCIVEPLPATMSSGSNSYAGSYYAFVRATNSSGGLWIVPSNGVQSCTVSDISGFSAPYASMLIAARKDGAHTWYTNKNCSLIFPVTNTISYSINLYVTSVPPPPTNGQPLTLQIMWSTNSLSATNLSQNSTN